MTIIIGADAHGVELKEVIRQHLTRLGKEIIDLTDTSKDFVDNTLAIVAKHIVEGFVDGTYDAGRHQIRVDMLNKMC